MEGTKERNRTRKRKGKRLTYARVMSAMDAFSNRRLYHFVTFSCWCSLGVGFLNRVICSIKADENLSKGSRTFMMEYHEKEKGDEEKEGNERKTRERKRIIKENGERERER